MFRIGEFAQIGRVSGRQLRHYDRLGLLQPDRIDPQTGYRYYSAGQLPRLNRLLALKDLGFSLDQIGRLLDDDVPADEMRGMLAIRKAQVERDLAEEQARLRQIESRIEQIEEQGRAVLPDIVLRPAPARPYLAVRRPCEDMDAAVEMLGAVSRAGRRRLRPAERENLVVVAHSEFDGDVLDLEFGFTLSRPTNTRVELPGGGLLEMRELEAASAVASLARSGPPHEIHRAFGALGVWMEANRFRIAGPCREVFLEMPGEIPGRTDVVVDVQFPVTAATEP
ncbi:MAG: hypothetical protein TEF_16725 [Rhizobiales bacterium NRL2]|jgi:DNA-binding transcriptional MerR regulator|nr:MAG: hypothetical protein TEF_16725 [Rhizobiales bacterium NRL2]